MIPGYQEIFMPLLKSIGDSSEHKFRDLIEQLAQHFNLTEEEREELLPSGKQGIFENRVGWAKTYLKKAKLLDTPRRATIVITERGLDVIKENPRDFNAKFLRRYPEFIEFQQSKPSETDSREEEIIESVASPEEVLEVAYQNIRKGVAQELLARVLDLSPSQFEKLVVELLVKMGYGGSIKDAGKAIGKSGDEGIDGTIKEDKLGLDVIYVQAKRWGPENTVGRPEIQKFVGALAGQGAKKGVFITTSSFSREAREYTPRNETKIVLLDGNELAQLMIDNNLGVLTTNIYEVKRIDGEYFGD
jgi:restriction system protein